MSKPLKVAGEVDSFCTKCKMVLNHRIVSMKLGKAHQVMCLTCDGAHLYRADPSSASAAPEGPERTVLASSR